VIAVETLGLKVSGVYELHFASPISDAHTTQHYIGYADDIKRRLEDHRASRGARLTEVANQRGIGFWVSRVWEGKDRSFERNLKNRKEGTRLCPDCDPNAMNRANK
jgi:predicted GIY-YIG superfamily endonuclease